MGKKEDLPEEEKEQKRIKPETPDQPEEPEEGFVPYVDSDEAKSERKSKIKIRAFVVLLVLCVIGFSVILLGKKYNLYSKAMKELSFDYRTGEADVPDESLMLGACGTALAEKIGSQKLELHAWVYLFDGSVKVSDTVSKYDYQHDSDQDYLKVRSGSKGWFVTQKMKSEIALIGGKRTAEQQNGRPLLSELLFDAAPHDALAAVECYDTYRAEVSGKQYTCEIWLICDIGIGVPRYYTVYRYYNNGTLAAARILNDQDEIMEVYDITEYTIG